MTSIPLDPLVEILDMPREILVLITKNLKDFDGLLNLKMSCAYFNKVITQFSLTRELIRDKIMIYDDLDLCINVNCYEDTQDIYEDYYFVNTRRYIHHHQRALNDAQIRINQKNYIVCSPYCNECYVKYVAIGDKKNVTRDFVEGEVIIDY